MQELERHASNYYICLLPYRAAQSTNPPGADSKHCSGDPAVPTCVFVSNTGPKRARTDTSARWHLFLVPGPKSRQAMLANDNHATHDWRTPERWLAKGSGAVQAEAKPVALLKHSSRLALDRYIP